MNNQSIIDNKMSCFELFMWLNSLFIEYKFYILMKQ